MQQLDQATSRLEQVGVDPTAEGGAEIYVSQRGADKSGWQTMADKGPILVFNENGDLKRRFGGGTGDGHIVQNITCPKDYPKCTVDHTFGGHGLSVRPDPGEGATQIWVDDFYAYARATLDLVAARFCRRPLLRSGAARAVSMSRFSTRKATCSALQVRLESREAEEIQCSTIPLPTQRSERVEWSSFQTATGARTIGSLL